MAEDSTLLAEPVVVAKFYSFDLWAARLAQARLEAEGIGSHLCDEYFAIAEPFYSPAIGGMRLMVPAADAEAGREIVGELERARCTARTECPECGSTDVRERAAERRWAIAAFIVLGLPLGRTTRKFRCDACGHAWRS